VVGKAHLGVVILTLDGIRELLSESNGIKMPFGVHNLVVCKLDRCVA